MGQWHDQPDRTKGETWQGFPGRSPPVSFNYGRVDGRDFLFVLVDSPRMRKIGIVPISRGVWQFGIENWPLESAPVRSNCWKQMLRRARTAKPIAGKLASSRLIFRQMRHGSNRVQWWLRKRRVRGRTLRLLIGVLVVGVTDHGSRCKKRYVRIVIASLLAVHVGLIASLAQSPATTIRVAAVTPAPDQPQATDKAVIFYEDFDRLPEWRTRFFEYVPERESFVWTPDTGLHGGAMRCQFEKGQVSAGSLKVLFGKNPFGGGCAGMKPSEKSTGGFT